MRAPTGSIYEEGSVERNTDENIKTLLLPDYLISTLFSFNFFLHLYHYLLVGKQFVTAYSIFLFNIIHINI